ncbi:MAG: YkoF family thiamine/hydroxymethylpyrimidine-binding protein [Tissierellaceae bacterium]
MEEKKVISCQITYLPIGKEDYSGEVEEVLELISLSGLSYNIDIMSTTIQGKADRIFTLISDIYEKMSVQGNNFTMNIIISNVCGC